MEHNRNALSHFKKITRGKYLPEIIKKEITKSTNKIILLFLRGFY